MWIIKVTPTANADCAKLANDLILRDGNQAVSHGGESLTLLPAWQHKPWHVVEALQSDPRIARVEIVEAAS